MQKYKSTNFNFDEFNKKLKAAKNRMFCNYAFYFGATPNNMKELNAVDTLEGCCGVKLCWIIHETSWLAKKDIEKVISNSSKIISVHSEDENILLSRKNILKMEMFTHIRFEKRRLYFRVYKR